MDTSTVLQLPRKLTLQQLVLLDTDVRLIMAELPIVWNIAWKQVALLGAQNQNAFESE